MTRVLVLGAAGMLGHKLCQILPQHGLDVSATVRSDASGYARFEGVFDQVELIPGVDVLDEPRLDTVIGQCDPEIIVNSVGIVKQLKEAADPYISVGINSWLPHRLARLCGEQDRRLIHISTDCVFEGTEGQYREDSPSTAVDLYGKSKYLGETTATEKAAVTLRTSIIGRELKTPGHGLLEWFLSQEGAAVRGFRKAIFSGLTTHELADVIARVIRDAPALNGVYHVASAPISKFDLLGLIRDVYGLEVDILPEDGFRCDRSLVMERFTADTGYTAPAWPEMIRRVQKDPTSYQCWRSPVPAS